MAKITKDDLFEKDIFSDVSNSAKNALKEVELLKSALGTKEQTELLRSIDNNLRFFFWITIIPIAIFVALFGVKFLMSM